MNTWIIVITLSISFLVYIKFHFLLFSFHETMIFWNLQILCNASFVLMKYFDKIVIWYLSFHHRYYSNNVMPWTKTLYVNSIGMQELTIRNETLLNYSRSSTLWSKVIVDSDDGMLLYVLTVMHTFKRILTRLVM